MRWRVGRGSHDRAYGATGAIKGPWEQADKNVSSDSTGMHDFQA